jgi:threonine dehydrogenase-like Zn-dependent dehydrogenase
MPSGRVAVIGAGTTPLVGVLAAEGFGVTAIDISTVAIEALRSRCEVTAATTFVVADACEVRLDPPVDTWHDRAVFHFLVDAAERDAYVAAVRASVAVGGHVVLAAFAPGGPDRCSGLAVLRHDAASLLATFGPTFDLVDSFEREHATPRGASQRFTHAVLRRSR